MAVWFPDEIDEWFGGDMDAAREHMAYEREQVKANEETDGPDTSDAVGGGDSFQR